MLNLISKTEVNIFKIIIFINYQICNSFIYKKDLEHLHNGHFFTLVEIIQIERNH